MPTVARPWTLATALAALALTLAPADVRADLTESRVTFSFGDDDVLHGPGTTTPSSPGAGFVPGDGGASGDVVPTARRDDTSAHLVLYKGVDGLIPRLRTEAALVVELDMDELSSRNPYDVSDDGTYLNVSYGLSDRDADRLQVTMYPFQSDRFRLGHSYDLSWGGTRIFGPTNRKPTPGMRVRLDHGVMDAGAVYGYLGAKTAQLDQYAEKLQAQKNDEVQTFYAVLGGVGFDSGAIRADLNGGWFQRGTLYDLDVRGESVDSAGASLQVAAYDGMEVPEAPGFRMYREDPTRIPERPAAQGASAGWVAAAEATWVGTTLQDPETRDGTRLQGATAGDLNLGLRLGQLTTTLDLSFRDVAFILLNAPSWEPFVDFLPELETSGELRAALGLMYDIPGLDLTPGVVLGAMRPASVSAVAQAGPRPPGSLTGRRTYVIFSDDEKIPLPAGEDALPVLGAEVQLRWDLSGMLTVLGEVFLYHDPNRSELEDDVVGVATRVFEDPLRAGFMLLAQARL